MTFLATDQMIEELGEMTAYDPQELAAAAEEDRMDCKYLDNQRKLDGHEAACLEYAAVCWDDDGDLPELIEAFYSTHDEAQIAILWDQIKQYHQAIKCVVMARNKAEQDQYKKEAEHHDLQIINWLARAVDRGCLLEDEE